MSPSAAASKQHIVQQLEPMRGKRVSVVLNDGRHLLATLSSYDDLSNIVLGNATELLYAVSAAAAPSSVITRDSEVLSAAPQTVFIRGTMVAAIGLVDTLMEASDAS